MQALKAHVVNGQIVLDEPIELPEGSEAQVILHVKDPHDDMSDEEKAELNRAIDEGLADVEAGNVVEFREVLEALGTT